jgi:hypothetical protein
MPIALVFGVINYVNNFATEQSLHYFICHEASKVDVGEIYFCSS